MSKWFENCSDAEFEAYYMSDDFGTRYHEGEHAYFCYKNHSIVLDCPYEPATKEFWAWQSGYDEAKGH